MGRRIQITQYYIGHATNEQQIRPGVYEVGDPALHGLEDYLVNDQGKAVYLDPADEALHMEAAELPSGEAKEETTPSDSEPKSEEEPKAEVQSEESPSDSEASSSDEAPPAEEEDVEIVQHRGRSLRAHKSTEK